MYYAERLKNIWGNVYDPTQDTKSVIEVFFHPDFEQCINGVVMKRTEYVEHVIAQKKNMTIESIEYKNFLEEGEELFIVYYPKAKDLEGADIEAEVIGHFHFKSNQIFKVHGQVRLIKGNPADVDMEN